MSEAMPDRHRPGVQRAAATRRRLAEFGVVPPHGSGMGDALVGTVICDIALPGEPVSKQRPGRRAGRTYTAAETRRAEDAIRWQLRAAGVRPDGDHTVEVRASFCCSTAQRRDIDNLLKLVLDACNGFAWGDDVQVEQVTAVVVRRAPEVGTHLTITRLARYTRDCGWCGVAISPKPGRPRRDVRYCSKACYDAAQRPGTVVACAVCSRPLYRQPSETTKAMVCSRECDGAYKRGRRAE